MAVSTWAQILRSLCLCFNQGQGAIIGAAAQLRRSRRLYVGEALKVRSAVRSARNRYVLARAQVEFDRKHLLPLATSHVDATQLNYNAMTVGVFELLRAKREELEVKVIHTMSVRDYWAARAELKKAVAGQLPTPAE